MIEKTEDFLTRIKRNLELCADISEMINNDFCLEIDSIISKISTYKKVGDFVSSHLQNNDTKHEEGFKKLLRKTQKLLSCVYIKEEQDCETHITICINEKKLESIRNPFNSDLPLQMWVIVNAIESIIRFLEHTGGSERLSYHDSVYYLKVPKKAYTNAT